MCGRGSGVAAVTIAVDREAVKFEKDKIGARYGKDKKKVLVVEEELLEQIERLKKLRKRKGCSTSGANLKQASDFEVYKRADEGVLNSARVIERAKAGKLVEAEVDFLVNGPRGISSLPPPEAVGGEERLPP